MSNISVKFKISQQTNCYYIQYLKRTFFVYLFQTIIFYERVVISKPPWKILELQIYFWHRLNISKLFKKNKKYVTYELSIPRKKIFWKL